MFPVTNLGNVRPAGHRFAATTVTNRATLPCVAVRLPVQSD
jgi:hypothetical protein